MTRGRHSRSARKPKRRSETDLLDKFSPFKVGRVVPTSVKQREDAFTSFRPQKGECLDYGISQTVVRMDAGDVKINVKDTEACYVPAPPPPPKKKKRPQTPPLKFITEIWLEEQDALQEKYKTELPLFIKHSRKVSELQANAIHDFILSLIGPEWFQELSPKQIRTVDQLECCILLDLKNCTLKNVQENIAQLGLALLPCRRHVAKALKLCCKNPAEFLLILYQLINPCRTEYSLNDRLLLSAVVHLCMTQTLRELHVRIPSPPARKKNKAKRKKRRVHVEYASPYLRPQVSHVPPMNKYKIYESSRMQYPESPYFAYLDSLPIERLITDDVFDLDLAGFDPEDVELLEDMRVAQLKYDRLWNGERVKLLRPTILKLCPEASSFYEWLFREPRPPLVLPPLATLTDSENEECFCSKIAEEDGDICCDYETRCCECEGKCRCAKKSRLYTSPRCRGCLSRERKKHVQRAIKGIAMSPGNEAIPIVEGTLPQETCGCLQLYREQVQAAKARSNLMSQRAGFIIGGVAMTRNGPVYILSAAVKKIKRKAAMDPTQKAEERRGSLEKGCGTSEKSREGGSDEKSCKKKKTNREDGDGPECMCKTMSSCGDEPEYMCKTASSCGDDPEYMCKTVTSCGESTDAEETAKNCTCKKHVDDTDCEKETPYPCDCEFCECREKSKVYTGSKCKECQERERLKYVERIITGLKETASQKVMPVVGGMRQLKPPSCDCIQKYAEKIISMEARTTIQNQKAQFVIGGVTMTERGPVYQLSTALLRGEEVPCCKEKRKRSRSKTRPRVKCVPVKEKEEEQKVEEEEETEDEEDLKYSGCKCKQELERFLKHQCTCEHCNVKQRQAEAIYVMGGKAYSNTPGDGTHDVVQGVYGQRCDCLERHVEKIERLEDYRKRLEVRYNLKSNTLKYSIGGVVTTPRGPVYVITGMRPPVDCECARAYREREEQELHLQQMARMPPTGRVKYQIAGVKQTQDGNVFIITQALPIEDCDCVKLYDTFAGAHKACLDTYEDFLRQINEELEQYLAEADGRYPQIENEPSDYNSSQFTAETQDALLAVSEKQSHNSFSHYNLFEKGQVVKTVIRSCGDEKGNICGRVEVPSFRESFSSECECTYSEGHETEVEGDASTSESLQCADVCLDDFQSISVPVKKVEEKEPKRFVILDEIPFEFAYQSMILKKVLNQMAEDGFPLAKLPDCHKLPHFKLWMQLRCGVYWRQRDINGYENFSKWGWSHTSTCPIEYKLPSLGISKKKMRELTWRNANYIKKLVDEKTIMFYRQVGHKAVDRAREFFPTTFSYEFTNKTYRDVFFAYLPSKEKSTHAIVFSNKRYRNVTTKIPYTV